MADTTISQLSLNKALTANNFVPISDGTTTTKLGTDSLFGYRNRIINGDMRIDQRGPINVTPGGGDTYISTDRFSLLNYFNPGQINTTKSSIAPAGYSNSLALTVASPVPLNGTTGYGCGIRQTIEGYNIADAYNSFITLSFWVRSSIPGTYSITFANARYGNIGTNRLYVVNYTISSQNVWEQKTVTINLQAGTSSGTWNNDNQQGLTINWNLGAENNRKGNSALNNWFTEDGTYPSQSSSQINWASNIDATFYLTGVQLEEGSTATPFEFRPIGVELALCQRYYFRTSGLIYYTGYGNNPGLNTLAQISTPVTMRVTPDVTFTDASFGSTFGAYALGTDTIVGTAYANQSSAPRSKFQASAEL